VKGSATVFINGLQAARIGDSTAHGGVIVAGCPTVIIGDVGGGGAFAAAISSSMVPGFSPSAALSGAAAGAAQGTLLPAILSAMAGPVQETQDTTDKPLSWYKAKVVNPDGTPAPGLSYSLKLPDGSEATGATDGLGMVKVGGIPPGQCQLRLLTVDKTLWKRT
jgi:hypothetical protein